MMVAVKKLTTARHEKKYVAAFVLGGCSFVLLCSGLKQTAVKAFRGREHRIEENTGVNVRGSGNGPFRHIFVCGYNKGRAIEVLFPEYDGTYTRVRKDEVVGEVPVPTKDDLLISGYGPFELNKMCAESIPSLDGEVLKFPGKMMFFNHEAADTQSGPRPIGGTGGPADACGPGPKQCLELQGTVASQAAEFEKPGGRFNYLPPSDRAYFFGPHPDSDRSMKLPLFSILSMLQTRTPRDLDWLQSDVDRGNNARHFAVFLSSHCVPWRDEAAKRLAQFGEVHVTEKWMKECADKVPDPTDGPKPILTVPPDLSKRDEMFLNHQPMKQYKFALVMENTYREGYITEKIIAAFRAGTVPIWYGGKDALDIFNPDAFVYYDVENPGPALDRIFMLLDNPVAYGRALRAPILKEGERMLEEYFSYDDRIGGGKLRKRIRQLIGVDQEGDTKLMSSESH